MTDDDRKCDLFLRALSLLKVDDSGLTDATDFDDLRAITQICPEIKEIIGAGPSGHPRQPHAARRQPPLTVVKGAVNDCLAVR
jgi:hypothetical protein